MEDLFKYISVSGRGFNMQRAATKTLLVPCAEVCKLGQIARLTAAVKFWRSMKSDCRKFQFLPQHLHYPKDLQTTICYWQQYLPVH